MKSPRNFKSYLKFVLVACVLMFLVDHFVWDGERPYIRKIKEDYYREQAEKQKALEELLPPEVVYPEDGSEYFEAPSDLNDRQSLLPEKQLKITEALPKKKIPTKKKFAKGERGKIAIVIDDVGMNIKQSRAAIKLPAEVTLAFLPYAKSVRSLAKEAQQRKHEIILHAPMEAMNSDMNLGSMALRSGMDFAAFDAEFNKIANSFTGYVGVNNHMGSRLTQDPEAMRYLMDQLKQRGLYFLDSKTINTSIAAQTAHSYGIPYAVRDVFLDHEETPAFVSKALKNVERVARNHGQAIAIGHPKAVTMKALRKWIPTLEAKGYELVPLSELIIQPQNNIKLVEINRSVKPVSAVPSAAPVRLNLQLPE